ncbi:hypothetical protein [Tamaricihabitans halophyticus]|uniref:hypothetical protein n=1 Tax=Tamaricihabitans halophyticus TaxID=1262583 RepID=UPI00104543AB|nr:hypothetical protein [Tamaricihabitans halophyticus]
MRDQLAVKADQGKLNSAQQATQEINGVVESLQNRSEPWAARSEVSSRVDSSVDLSVRLDTKLGELIEANVSGQLPDTGSLLTTVNDLLQSLLTQLSGLLDGLLGGGAPPLPIPEPEVPPVPVP